MKPCYMLQHTNVSNKNTQERRNDKWTEQEQSDGREKRREVAPSTTRGGGDEHAAREGRRGERTHLTGDIAQREPSDP